LSADARLLLSLATLMSSLTPVSPERAVSDDDDADNPPETPQQRLDALCVDINFNDDLQISSEHGLGHGILCLLPPPPLSAPPTTPLDETILGLKVEVERLVEELALVRSRAELTASAHQQTVVDHTEERAAIVLQATQKGALLALAKREIKELSDELKASKAKAIELSGNAILTQEEAKLAEMYVRYLEAGHTMTAPPGGIVLQTKPRFCATTWLALGAVCRSKDLMAKDFLIPEGVRVRPFIAWIH